jgi:hypothetical protein
MAVLEVTELWGDGIGPELREACTCGSAPPLDLRFLPLDPSLANTSASASGCTSRPPSG